ncbi:MAG: glycosyltransferase family 10, partial [Oculatellaceae cyanobacterium bins.114]|nr:glycosyltransferase family 10 [Oculatellaceae cyanobacterium bins.114]
LMYNFNTFPGKKARKKGSFWEQLGIKSRIAQEEQKMQDKLRNVPKERVIFAVREPPFVEKQKRRIKDYQLAERYCGYVSGPDDFAPITEPMSAIWYHPNSFRDLDEMGVPDKVSPCSWITSGIDRTANHQNRLNFIRLLRESGLEFDLYGRGLPDWAKGNGQLLSKWNAMAPYYYNLAIENFAENDWYVSEKLWDSLLAWCLPIYYGGPAADRLLPPGSFLRLPSMDEKGLAYIKEVTATPDAWHEAKDAIAEARQVILHELNLLNWLSKTVKQLSSS